MLEAASLETALALSGDVVAIHQPDRQEEILFSQNFACPGCGILLPELSPRMFSFNNPYGACTTCSGLGFHLVIDADKLIPDRTRSLNDGAVNVYGWKNVKDDSICKMYYETLGQKYNFDLDTPIKDLSAEALNAILNGTNDGTELYGKNRTAGF